MADKKFGVKQINLIGASGTPTLTSPNNLNINAINVAISTDLSVGGNISVGGTFSSLSVSGVSTFQSNVYLGDSDRLYFGDGNDLEIYSTGTAGIIKQNTSNLFIRGSGTPGDDVYIQTGDTNSSAITARHDGGVEIYYDNAKKFETITNGVTVTGTTNTNQLVVSGISTLGASTVFTTVDNLGNIGIGTNRTVNEYSTGKSTLVIDGRTWPGNPNVKGGGSLQINSNGKKFGEITATDGVGIGSFFLVDAYVPLSINDYGTNNYAYVGIAATFGSDVTVDNNLSVSGVSTFSGDVSVGVNTSAGIILRSPNGTAYRLVVDNSGNLTTTLA